MKTTTDSARCAAYRRGLGTVALLATTAAMAGLGTFGTFTDSTSAATTAQSGIVAIDVGAPGGMKTIPQTTSGFLAGDSISRAINLENNGDTALSSVTFTTRAGTPNALVTDQVNGLQLTLRSCTRKWTEGGTAEAPTYTCDGTERLLRSGPVLGTQTLSDPASLQPGRDDHLVFTIFLPTTAGNDMQGLSAALELTFDGVQRPGTER